jgi:hypothetical protein
MRAIVCILFWWGSWSLYAVILGRFVFIQVWLSPIMVADQTEGGQPMITRKRALEILIDHDQYPDEPSATLNGEWVDDSTFNKEVGVKSEYQLMEVLGWLGYCCKYC